MKGNQTNYAATATHDTWGNQSAPGTIHFDAHSLYFVSSHINLTCALEAVSMEAAGNQQILFTDGTQPEWQILCSDPEVLQNFFVQKRNHLRAQAREISGRRQGSLNLKLAAGFLVAFAVIFLVAMFAGRIAVGFAVNRVPVAWEVELSDESWKELQIELDEVDDPALLARLRQSISLLTKNATGLKYEYQVVLVDGFEPNAFAMPGGRIVVTTGLFKVLETPEEVAGVLAHEIAHVQRRHGLRTIVSQAGPFYVLELLGGSQGSFVTALGQGSQLVLGQHYSRAHEREADQDGWELLIKARIDPRGLASALRKFQQWEEEIMEKMGAQIALLEKADRLLSSHPPTPERVQYLDELWEKSNKPTGFTTLPKFELAEAAEE